MAPSSAPFIPSDLPLVDVHEPGAISRQHVERLHAHRSAYRDRFPPGIEAARHLSTAPATGPRKAGLRLYRARASRHLPGAARRASSDRALRPAAPTASGQSAMGGAPVAR
jgi:hypothetical protein